MRVTVADVNILGGDGRKILEIMKGAKRAFTVEDHNVNGGLGSFVCRLACENAPLPVTRIGLDRFPESGPAKELADRYGFSPEAIAGAISPSL